MCKWRDQINYLLCLLLLLALVVKLNIQETMSSNTVLQASCSASVKVRFEIQLTRRPGVPFYFIWRLLWSAWLPGNHSLISRQMSDIDGKMLDICYSSRESWHPPWINAEHLFFGCCCCFCLLLALLQIENYSVNSFSVTSIIYWLLHGSSLFLKIKLQSPSWSDWQWEGYHLSLSPCALHLSR